MSDKRLLRVNYDLQIAKELFNAVTSPEDVKLDCDEYQKLIYPNDALRKAPVKDTLRYVSAERVTILQATILLQFSLAALGKARVEHMAANKEMLIQAIPAPEIEKAINTDIAQQSHDMAIMTTMSESALKFAEKFAGGSDAILDKYRDIVFDMLELYHYENAHFNVSHYTNMEAISRAQENFKLEDRNRDHMKTDKPVQTFIKDSQEVLDMNIQLAQMTERRFENGVRALYFWRQKLGHAPQQVDNETLQNFKVLIPQHGFVWEADTQKLYKERVQALSKRATLIEKHIGLITPYAEP